MARRLTVEIVGDASSLNRTLDETQHKTTGFASSLSGVAKGALAFGGVSVGLTTLTEGLKSSLESAEKYKQSQDSISTSLKTTGQNVSALLPQFDSVAGSAAQFGVSQTTALSGLAHAEALTGNAAKAMRAYREALDISKATGKDFNAVLVATSKAQDGNTGALGRYGVQVTKGMGGQAQLNAVMGKFAGQAAANTTPTQQLEAHLSNISTTIGLKLLPAFDDLITGVNKAITWIQDHWGQISAVIDPVIDAVKQKIQGVVEVFKGIIDVIDGLIHGRWGQVWDGVKEVVVGEFDFLLALPLSIAEKLAGAMGDLATGALNAFTGGVSALAGDMAGFLTDTVTAITGAVTGAATAALNFGGKILSGVDNAVSGLAGKVGGYITGAVTAVTDAVTGAGTEAARFGKKIFSSITDAVSGLAKQIAGYIGDAVSAVTDKVAGAGTQAAKFGGKIFDSIDNAVSGIGKAIGGYMSDITNAITGAVKDVGNAAVKFGASILAGIGSGLAGLAKKLESWIIDPLNSLIGTINNALDFTLPTVSINTHIPGVGKISVGGETLNLGGIPTIPTGRATGGPVTAGRTYMVGERGPELFTPGNTGVITPYRGGTGDTTVHVHVAGSVVTEQQLVETIRRGMLRIGQRNGTIFGQYA